MADTICTQASPIPLPGSCGSGLTNQKRRSMIEAMTEAELYAPVEWRDAPPVTRTSSITSPQRALPRSPSTVPRCATPSAPAP
jgi:hypothetical protein